MALFYAKAAAAAAVLALLLLELRDRGFRRDLAADRRRRSRNLWYLGASLAVMTILTPIGEALRELLPALADWRGGWWWEAAACTVAAELLGWVLHYAKHRNGFLWRFHFQHHRESRYNLWLATHTHALEVVVSGTVTAAALCLLGFSPAAAGAYLVFYSFAKVYQHSARDYSLGVLDRVIVGPRYHRLHHHREARCNYGTALTLFDVLFGTARWPAAGTGGAEVAYGISEQERLPFGFWPEMLQFLRARSPAVPDSRDGEPVGGPGTPGRERRPNGSLVG